MQTRLLPILWDRIHAAQKSSVNYAPKIYKGVDIAQLYYPHLNYSSPIFFEL